MPDLARLSELPAVPASRPQLGPGEVDVWYTLLPEVSPYLDACLPLLDAAEHARQQRFYFERDRSLYAVAHALVRTALSHYADVEPSAWQFDANSYGRPHVAGPLAPRFPWFNLSHTHGLVACAISGCHEQVGVDVEDHDRSTDAIEIADRFFSSFEVEALHRLPEAQQRHRFFAYWTLKESYIKARGMGLAIPLGQFSFELDAGRSIGIRFGAELDDEPSKWHFRRYRASARHMLALGMACGADTPLSVRGRPWSPAELVV